MRKRARRGGSGVEVATEFGDDGLPVMKLVPSIHALALSQANTERKKREKPAYIMIFANLV